MKTIATDGAPEAIGPYSQAVRSGEWLYISGQIPLDPATGAVSGTEIDSQAHRVMKNLGAILKAAGADYRHIVKTTIFLVNLDHFVRVNEIYAGYLKPPYPSRSTVQVAALPKGVLLEVEAVARVES